jgi:hypothetical protein
LAGIAVFDQDRGRLADDEAFLNGLDGNRDALVGAAEKGGGTSKVTMFVANVLGT